MPLRDHVRLLLSEDEIARVEDAGEAQHRITSAVNELFMATGLLFLVVEAVLTYRDGFEALSALLVVTTLGLLGLRAGWLARSDSPRSRRLGIAGTLGLLVLGSAIVYPRGATQYLFWGYIAIPITLYLEGFLRGLLWLGLFGLVMLLFVLSFPHRIPFAHVRELSLSFTYVVFFVAVYELLRNRHEKLLTLLNGRLQQLATTDALTRRREPPSHGGAAGRRDRPGPAHRPRLLGRPPGPRSLQGASTTPTGTRPGTGSWWRSRGWWATRSARSTPSAGGVARSS